MRAAVGCVCAVGQSCAVWVLAMWLQVRLSQARISKPHLSSKKKHKISRMWEFPPRRYFGMCGPRRAKYPNSPGSSKTPDAHNSALNDQYRDISEF